MKSWKLDRRIVLERATLIDDGFSQVEQWTLLAEVWASYKPVSDREKWQAGSVGAVVTDRFQIRWSEAVADLNPKDRLIYGGRVYDISGIKEIDRREGFEITANARAD